VGQRCRSCIDWCAWAGSDGWVWGRGSAVWLPCGDLAAEPELYLRRYPSRVFNVSAYDALTGDARLARSPGFRKPLSLVIHA
jgi:hypothetical protein